MEFKIENHTLKVCKYDCVIIPIFGIHLSLVAKELDFITNGYINNFLIKKNVIMSFSKYLFLYDVPNTNFKKVLFVKFNENNKICEFEYDKIIKSIINAFHNNFSKEIIFFFNELNIINRDNYWKIRKTIENIQDFLYEFNSFKKSKNIIKNKIKRVIFNVKPSELLISKLAARDAISISNGVIESKNLSNMPSNICNSNYLLNKIIQFCKLNKDIKLQVINEKKMKELSMNAFLSVGMGSENESLMLIMHYNKNKDLQKNPIVFIGKGLTFDSGGLSIKPSFKLDEMKFDMCGAASIYGIMKFICDVKLKINVIGVLSCAENMLDSKSYRPGDIIKTMSGKTIEIINTDAEGRLVLCDSLTYVKKFNPELVIDIATLTGACKIALGDYYNGLMSNDDDLANELLYAAKQSGDKTWRLPLDKDFSYQLKSNCADIANSGGSSGSAISAACFLREFVEYKWAHIDIAGTAWKSDKSKFATGRPVILLSQFLLNRSKFYEKMINNKI